jgi:phosphoheptose isomerase
MERPDLKYVINEFQASLAVKQRILEDSGFMRQVTDMGHLLIDCYQAGNKLLVAGNGGSAADAQHIAAEFVSRFNFDRPGLPALALTTDTSILTAVGNDYGYDQLFRRQVEANGARGDVFLGISTSGNSPNILQAPAEPGAKCASCVTTACVYRARIHPGFRRRIFSLAIRCAPWWSRRCSKILAYKNSYILAL